MDEGPRQRDALLLASRELLRERAEPVVELDEPEHLVGAPPPLGRRDAEELLDVRDVLEDGPRREELVVLEDDARSTGEAPGPARRGIAETFMPFTMIWPSFGRSARKTRRRSVVFPAPEGPVRKTNSPFCTWNVTSFRTRRPWYSLATR